MDSSNKKQLTDTFTAELCLLKSLSKFDEIQASIFSTDGRQVMGDFYKPNSGYINMNISGLPQGIYILNIKTDNSLLNYKILTHDQ